MARRGAHLRLVGLTKRFEDVTAVADLSLDVEGGELVTLLGPSGSGKSTTLNMVAGFVTPTTGEIYLDGVPVTGQPPYRRGLGMVFQHYALFPHLSVFENVAFPLRVRRQEVAAMRRRIEEVLHLVGLTTLADRMPHQLSGGQQQRVALARALVFDPPVLLMDEPLGALDRKLRGHLQLEIKQLQHRLGVTVVYVTHDQEEALVLSDRIAIMNRGRLEQVGTPADLYERPVNQFVADFIGESNFLPGTVAARAEGVWTVRLAEGAQVQVRGNGGWRPGARVLLALRPEDLAVTQAPVAGANSLPGEIEGVLFVGESTKYAVRVGPALFLSARVQRGAAQFAQGDRVVLQWGMSAGRLLAASEQERG